jgi:hypothetical protein
MNIHFPRGEFDYLLAAQLSAANNPDIGSQQLALYSPIALVPSSPYSTGILI